MLWNFIQLVFKNLLRIVKFYPKRMFKFVWQQTILTILNNLARRAMLQPYSYRNKGDHNPRVAKVLRKDKGMTGEKSFSQVSPVTESSVLPSSCERTTKPRVSCVVVCARAFLSRPEIISAVLIRLMSGPDSSLLAILSLTRFLARELFFPCFLPSPSSILIVLLALRFSTFLSHNCDTPLYR